VNALYEMTMSFGELHKEAYVPRRYF
jgi:hypothetical protein